MKKAKKILMIAMAVVMTGAIIACGVNSTPTNNEVTESPNNIGIQIWKIGGMGSISADKQILGQAVQHGTQLAVDEINMTGGIHGAIIDYYFEDDAGDSEKGITTYDTLKSWGIHFLIGPATNTPCMAVATKTAADHMFQITPTASSADILEGKSNVFQVCATNRSEGQAGARYIGENNMASRVAVIYDSSDPCSVGVYEAFIEEAVNYSYEIVSAEAFTDDSSTDFFNQLKKDKDAGAELLFLPIYCEQAAKIIAQADALEYKPTIFGCSGMDGILEVENFDKDLAEGVIFFTYFDTEQTDDYTKNFIEKYKAVYGEEPNQFAASAYDSVFIVKKAIEAAGVTPDMSVNDICEALKKAMTEITVDGVTGTGMTWNASGEVVKEPRAVVIKDGIYVDY